MRETVIGEQSGKALAIRGNLSLEIATPFELSMTDGSGI
jgi:hypothetical protein